MVATPPYKPSSIQDSKLCHFGILCFATYTNDSDITSHIPNTGPPNALPHLFRVGSDSSVSPMDTVIPAKSSKQPTHAPATLSEWQVDVWSAQPTTHTARAVILPPPYSKSSSFYNDESKSTPEHIPRAIEVDIGAQSAPSNVSRLSHPVLDAETQTHNMLKAELATYPYKKLLNYSVQKTQAYHAAVHKISRLQQHVNNLEKLERCPHRRTRRWLLLVTVLLAALMIVAWSLAGVWKVERDVLIKEAKEMEVLMSKTPEVKKPVSIFVTASSTVSSVERSTLVPITVSAERTTTEVSSVTATSITTRKVPPDEGDRRGLPHHCIDRGNGGVDCLGGLLEAVNNEN